MRPGISVTATAADRRRLAAIGGDRNSPQKHLWRGEIVLLTADGVGTVEMRRTGKAKHCVWRWQERFAQEGFTRPMHTGCRRFLPFYIRPRTLL
jgi:hypothetical protein